MLSKRWDEIKDKLHAALELEPPQRSLYLQKIAEADAELGLELESLVASHERASTDFLNTSPLQGVSNQQSPHKVDLMIGRRLGNYEVVAGLRSGIAAFIWLGVIFPRIASIAPMPRPSATLWSNYLRRGSVRKAVRRVRCRS